MWLVAQQLRAGELFDLIDATSDLLGVHLAVHRREGFDPLGGPETNGGRIP
jgi:hypothetical protein